MFDVRTDWGGKISVTLQMISSTSWAAHAFRSPVWPASSFSAAPPSFWSLHDSSVKSRGSRLAAWSLAISDCSAWSSSSPPLDAVRERHAMRTSASRTLSDTRAAHDPPLDGPGTHKSALLSLVPPPSTRHCPHLLLSAVRAAGLPMSAGACYRSIYYGTLSIDGTDRRTDGRSSVT